MPNDSGLNKSALQTERGVRLVCVCVGGGELSYVAFK